MTAAAVTCKTIRRKPPADRKQEIAEAAGRIAEIHGLAQLTARKVADAIGVYPGLVNHYFRSADELAAAAFVAANNRLRAEQAAVLEPESRTSVDWLRAFLRYAASPDFDSTALLWLDAWRESPRRPALQREVVDHMEGDLTELTEHLRRGVSRGEFHIEDCDATATRILALVDGTFAQAAVRNALPRTSLINYPAVAEMLVRTAEKELSLPHGTLD